MKRLHMVPLLFMLSIVLVSISFPIMNADAKKVIIENITLNVTVIIPITVVAQNAQICISLASSGDQTCQQIVLDPTQTSYTAVDVDLTESEPVITTSLSNQTSTNSAINDTSSSTNETSSSSSDTSSFAGKSNRTFEAGKSDIINPSIGDEPRNDSPEPHSKSSNAEEENNNEPSGQETEGSENENDDNNAEQP
jgi:hypothetical protein